MEEIQYGEIGIDQLKEYRNIDFYYLKAYGLKSYWKNGEYFEEKISNSEEFKLLAELLSKNIK